MKAKTRAQIRRRYVRTAKMGDKWNTYLQIDGQGFCVVDQTTEKRAKWFGNMLAAALQKLIAKQAQ